MHLLIKTPLISHHRRRYAATPSRRVGETIRFPAGSDATAPPVDPSVSGLYSSGQGPFMCLFPSIVRLKSPRNVTHVHPAAMFSKLGMSCIHV
jgi:hypothetical protein